MIAPLTHASIYPPCEEPLGLQSLVQDYYSPSDFCRPCRTGSLVLSPSSRPRQISRGKFDCLPHAPPSYTMCPLWIWTSWSFSTRPAPSASYRFLFIGSHVLSTRFFQTPPHGDALALRYHFHLHQVVEGTHHPQAATNMLGTQKKPRATRVLFLCVLSRWNQPGLAG